MRIGIITDAHLFHRYAITPEKYKDILNNMDVDIIVDCGDLTDKSNLNASQLDNMSKIFKDITKPMYIVAGNHDSLDSTTVASILNLNDNIHIIKNEPQIIDGMLFVPYTDDIKGLYKKLDKLVDEQVAVMFSHLNITDNIYASIPFRNLPKIQKYAERIFNGHIHDYEENFSVYGCFYNIGSSSSLTFGDEHYPCYTIYDTEDNKVTNHVIYDSIVHKTYDVSKQDVDVILQSIKQLTKQFKLRCRLNMPNNVDSVELRKKLKEKLELNDRVVSVTFNYIKDKEIAKKNKEKTEEKLDKTPLMEQLFNYFEKDCEIKLDEEIKKELL